MRKIIAFFLLLSLLFTGCTPNDASGDNGDTDQNQDQNGETDNETGDTGRNMNVCVNVAADGIESEIIKNTKLDKVVYEKSVASYVASYLNGTNVGRMFYNVSYRRSVVDSDTVDSMLYNVVRDADGFLIRDEYGDVTISGRSAKSTH
jgi:hypothetical protein